VGPAYAGYYDEDGEGHCCCGGEGDQLLRERTGLSFGRKVRKGCVRVHVF
jgi:hypothetical protein